MGSWKAIGVDGEPIPAGSKEKINMVIRSDGTYRIDLWDKLGIHSWSEGTWETYDSNEYTGEILFTRINGDNGPCNSDCDFDLDFELVGDRQFMQIWIEDEEELQVITFKRTSPVPQASPEPKQQREVRGVVRNSDGIPILNVTVSVDALGDSPAVLTNDKGQFTIKVPAGRQQLKFEKAGYKELKVWVEANQTEVGPIYLEALPPREVRGVVRNSDGIPILNVTVSVDALGDSPAVLTN
ncbi:MAG: carboxypeptidase-like regulatory domain-containing protein, partial [Candidatus Methanosuratincola sp.]